MKFSKVRLSSPTGVELAWRGSSSSVFQLEVSQGWSMYSAEHGIVATHDSRPEHLFLPWSIVGTCDVLPEADAVKAKKAS